MTMNRKPHDIFGLFLMKNLRDNAIEYLDTFQTGRNRAPELLAMQDEFTGLTPETKALFRRVFVSCLDAAIHDFLFALQEEHDGGGAVAVMAGNTDIASTSEALHAELFGSDGWYARFSRYGGQAG